MAIKHYSHADHPLRLITEYNLIGGTKCGICFEPIVASPFYACELCKYYVHKHCADLPRHIDHRFHPDHMLKLSYEWRGHSCGRSFDHSLVYTCRRCDFDMDVECALMMAPTPEQQRSCIQHSGHPHWLFPLINGGDCVCLACKARCSGQSVYGCERCSFFSHKSCAELPRQIHHPLHPQHGALYTHVRTRNNWTSLCVFSRGLRHKKHLTCNIALECPECDFALCWPCGKNAKRVVTYRDHDHNLYFLEGNDTDPACQCDVYDGYCKRPVTANSRELARSGVLVCVEKDCSFKVHLLCGLLPHLVKHECHIHALSLLDSLSEDDSGEYYCDVCEEERDPRIRLYACKECKYFAHVHCIISEVSIVSRY